LRDWFLRHILIAVLNMRVRHVPSGFWTLTKEVLKSQWMPKDELRKRQIQGLRRILHHSYDNIPFYNRIFRERNLKPDDFRSLEDLQRLPVVTRADLKREYPDGVVAKSLLPTRGSLNATSGTTGSPFSFYNDAGPELGWHVLASRLLLNSMAGVRPMERCVYFSRTVDPAMMRFRELQLSALEVSRRSIEELVSVIKRYKPVCLGGYASTLSFMAALMQEMHQPLDLRLKAVICTAEILLSSQRRNIEENFGCDVFDRYGSRELSGYVAQECPFHSGLHVNSELVLLEVVDDGETVSAGEEGKIVATDLHNFVMPFIRYDTQDVGVAGEDCACGRSMPVLKDIEGRSTDLLETESSDFIPLHMIANTIATKYASAFQQIQFIQRRRGYATVLAVPSVKVGERMLDEASEYLGGVFGGISFEIQLVEEIPQEKSGKRPLLRK